MAIYRKEHENRMASLYDLKKRNKFSDVSNSCFEGINRIFNNQNLYSKYRLMITSNRADHRALLSDWENVGTDLSRAIKDYEYSYLGEQSD